MVTAFDGLSEDLVSVLRIHVVVYHSGSKGSDTIFWLPAVAKHTCSAYTHLLAKNTKKILRQINKINQKIFSYLDKAKHIC